MKKFVIDTSVAVKWFSRVEEDTENALQLRQKMFNGLCYIIVPDLMIYELANALKHNPYFTKKNVSSALDSILDMGLDIREPDGSVMTIAIEIAYKYDVTVYDAYFIALSQVEKSPFITADYKFINRIKGFKGIIKLSEV